MKQILTGQVAMKPRWYFIVGSLLMFLGLIGSTIASIFLMSIISFSLRTHGPMGAIRFQQLVSNFSWWAPVLAILGLLCGIRLLKYYDISYKKNFTLVIIFFILAIIAAGLVMDAVGISAVWSRQGPMHRLYLQSEQDSTIVAPGGHGWRGMQHTTE